MEGDVVNPDVVEIEELLEAFERAVTAGDAKALSGCLAEDVTFTFTGGRGPVRDSGDVAATWARHLGQWSEVRIERRDAYVRIHGDTAWASFVWDGEGTAADGRFRVEGERWTLVLLWEEDGWRIVHGHSSLPYQDWDRLRLEGERG